MTLDTGTLWSVPEGCLWTPTGCRLVPLPPGVPRV